MGQRTICCLLRRTIYGKKDRIFYYEMGRVLREVTTLFANFLEFKTTFPSYVVLIKGYRKEISLLTIWTYVFNDSLEMSRIFCKENVY